MPFYDTRAISKRTPEENTKELQRLLDQPRCPLEVAQQLIRHGADINVQGLITGDSLLHRVVKGDLLRREEIEFFARHQANFEIKNNHGQTPLAVFLDQNFGEFEPWNFVCASRDHGVNFNTQNSAGQTLLHIIINENENDLIRALLFTDKVDVNITDNNGRTPLSLLLDKNIN